MHPAEAPVRPDTDLYQLMIRLFDEHNTNPEWPDLPGFVGWWRARPQGNRTRTSWPTIVKRLAEVTGKDVNANTLRLWFLGDEAISHPPLAPPPEPATTT